MCLSQVCSASLAPADNTGTPPTHIVSYHALATPPPRILATESESSRGAGAVWEMGRRLLV